MSKTDLVGKLIEKYFCVIQDGKSLSTGNEPALPEDAADFFEEYFKILDVDPTGFDFRKYFPRRYSFFTQCMAS